MAIEQGKLILYSLKTGRLSLIVRLKDETVWLSRKEMAVLFGQDYKTISKYINNVFMEEELRKNSVIAKFAPTGNDGKSYQVEYYNLDVVISVGYRDKSQQSTRFYIWASSVLKETILSCEGHCLKLFKLRGKVGLLGRIALLAAGDQVALG